ncbi:TetR/AcrR family transcriptional regulator [Jatrophihabitans fulvus]
MNDRVSSPTPGADGRHARWDAHRATRRRELIEAATLAIAEHGGDVGMDRIAAAAGTSKPVIYRYFDDRDELHRAVGRHVAGEIVQALQDVHAGAPAGTSHGADDPDDADEADEADDPRRLLHRAIDSYLAMVEQRPTLFRFVITLPTGTDGGRRPGDPIAAVLTAELGHHLSVRGLDPAASRPWGDAAVGFIRAASLWWLDHPDEMTRPQLTEYLTVLLWSGAAGVFTPSPSAAGDRPSDGVFRRRAGRPGPSVGTPAP